MRYDQDGNPVGSLTPDPKLTNPAPSDYTGYGNLGAGGGTSLLMDGLVVAAVVLEVVELLQAQAQLMVVMVEMEKHFQDSLDQ